ncbi:MAG: GNAT family N-acetyltransferase [Betaproteobacteria bacterium]|nr:GNAT family N-acetyltransferase [Betaproteobacteria bacterium]
MKIRLAEKADAAAVLALGRLMHEESRFRAYPLNPVKSMQLFDELLGHPGRAILLLAVQEDGAVTGMLGGYLTGLFFADAVVAQEQVFYVHPEARGGAAALKLLLAFRAWTEKQGAAEIHIGVSSGIDLDRFDRLMQRLGFTCSGSNYALALGGARAA